MRTLSGVTGTGVGDGAPDVSKDEGVILVWVALMLVALVGMGALVIDIGALYVEKRELQNGADAAALAVAQDCAVKDNCGSDGGSELAQDYADWNANDNASALDPTTPCGKGPGLDNCAPDDVPREGICQSSSCGWVRVGTSTETSDGGDEISFLLAPVISALTGKTVKASAVAAWGPMGSGAVVPLVFSLCEWTEMGGVLGEKLPDGRKAITFHGTGPDSVNCPIGPSGLDLPGGFGRVIAANCEADLAVDQWADVDPGANLAADCNVRSWQDQVVSVAIYDKTNGLTGANGQYHIAGLVGFKVLGYRIVASRGGGGVQKFGTCTPDSPSDQYLCGEFTPVTKDGGDFGTGPDFGARVIKMVD